MLVIILTRLAAVCCYAMRMLIQTQNQKSDRSLHLYVRFLVRTIESKQIRKHVDCRVQNICENKYQLIAGGGGTAQGLGSLFTLTQLCADFCNYISHRYVRKSLRARAREYKCAQISAYNGVRVYDLFISSCLCAVFASLSHNFIVAMCMLHTIAHVCSHDDDDAKQPRY